MGNMFCDETVAFEHDDRTIRPHTQSSNREVGIDLPKSIDFQSKSPVRVLTRGSSATSNKAERKESAGERTRSGKSREGSYRSREGSRASRERRGVDVSGSNGGAKDGSTEQRKVGACGSFWYGVVRGLIPVLILIGWCVKGVKGEEGNGWDERWMGYGTTLGLFVLVIVAIIIVLINIT